MARIHVRSLHLTIVALCAVTTCASLVGADTLSFRMEDGKVFLPLAGHEAMMDQEGRIFAVCQQPGKDRETIPTIARSITIPGSKAPLYVAGGAIGKADLESKCDPVYAFELSRKHSVALLTPEGKLAWDQKLTLVDEKRREKGVLTIDPDGKARFTPKKGAAVELAGL
jgi:hypothetical protein